MTAAEIVHEAIRSEYLQTKGKTPVKTLNARLATDILFHKADSRFMRSDASRFALREWQNDLVERIVPRRTVALIEEDILAFDASLLRNFVPQDGFVTLGGDHQNLLAQTFSVKRREAEERYDVIQLVSVFVVRHYQEIITHKRSSRLPEKRLQHSYSCFFGGHLTALDLMPLFRFSDPEQALYLLDRELSEEVRLRRGAQQIRFKGLIYDPRTIVSTQHLGIVFCVDVCEKDFEVGERGFLTDAKFERLADARNRMQDFENWSQLLIMEQIGSWN